MTKKFAKTLEEKANQLAAYPQKQQWDDSISSMIRREITLTVEQIQRLRERHDEQFNRLLRVECYVDKVPHRTVLFSIASFDCSITHIIKKYDGFFSIKFC